MSKHYFGEQGFCVFCGASQEDALSLPCEPIETPPDGFAYPMPEEVWNERIADGELDASHDGASETRDIEESLSKRSHQMARTGGDGASVYPERRRRFDSRLESRVLDLIHSGLAIRPH